MVIFQALFTAEYLEKFEENYVLSIFFTIWVKNQYFCFFCMIRKVDHINSH